MTPAWLGKLLVLNVVLSEVWGLAPWLLWDPWALKLVQSLAELHGGRAWIKSEKGRGTRVFVALPTRATHETATCRAQA